MAKTPTITVTIAIKSGYDSLATHTLNASIETDARLIGLHAEKTVENLRSEIETFATIDAPTSETEVKTD